MPEALQIGLVGDYDASVPAHRAIPIALQLAAESAAIDVQWQWVPTEEIRTAARISAFDGLWCVPACPYRHMEGALLAIQFARERGRHFLGTCGGFQHAVIEYARNVLKWTDVAHAEVSPEAPRPLIAPLACELVEKAARIQFAPGSRMAKAYDSSEATEGYHCRYGVNAAVREALVVGPLRAAAIDAAGDLRGIELDDHPFFVATLFQPERRALEGQLPPLVAAFIRGCAIAAERR